MGSKRDQLVVGRSYRIAASDGYGSSNDRRAWAEYLGPLDKTVQKQSSWRYRRGDDTRTERLARFRIDGVFSDAGYLASLVGSEVERTPREYDTDDFDPVEYAARMVEVDAERAALAAAQRAEAMLVLPVVKTLAAQFDSMHAAPSLLADVGWGDYSTSTDYGKPLPDEEILDKLCAKDGRNLRELLVVLVPLLPALVNAVDPS